MATNKLKEKYRLISLRLDIPFKSASELNMLFSKEQVDERDPWETGWLQYRNPCAGSQVSSAGM